MNMKYEFRTIKIQHTSKKKKSNKGHANEQVVNKLPQHLLIFS